MKNGDLKGGNGTGHAYSAACVQFKSVTEKAWKKR